MGLAHWLVIGAGLAGLTAARTLADRGETVLVVEKSRAAGGRLSTRRVGETGYDHGAQYLTARGKPFRALMTGLANQGSVALWGPKGKDRDEEWHVGQPGMRHLVEPLCTGIDIIFGARVDALEPASDGVVARWTDGEGASVARRFDRVISTIPSPQASALLAGHDRAFAAIADVQMAPCWALMLGFAGPIEGAADIYRAPNDAIGWIARNASKPQRTGHTFVVHASPDWSRAHLELAKENAASALLLHFRQATSIEEEPQHLDAHRWRYAFVEKPLGQPFLASADGRIFACGDWCIAPRAEAAFESARLLCDSL
jgi:renalase